MIAKATPIFDSGYRANQTTLSYDATVSNKRRKIAPAIMRSEDKELTQTARRQLIASARDLPRNFAIAAWAIRKHLDFVSTFHYHAATSDPGFNKELSKFIAWRSLKENCDITGRHDLQKMLRLAEKCRSVDGDTILVKQRNGSMQAIEGDRIKSSGEVVLSKNEQMIEGVVVNKAGRPKRYVIHSRWSNRTAFDRTIPARHIFHLGYFDRFDQIRGITPMAPAINSMRDVYENFDYALAKAKISQLFGYAMYRNADPDDNIELSSGNLTDGNAIFDMGPDDKIEFLESNQPSDQFQSYQQLMIGIALKSLDLPYTFYDESFTNFFGSRAALILYQKSTISKKADLKDFLQRWTHWQLQLGILSGDISLPRGSIISDIKHNWLPAGMPFWNPMVEYKAYKIAVDNAWISNAEVRKETHGDDIEGVYQALAQEKAMRESYGLTLESDLKTNTKMGAA